MYHPLCFTKDIPLDKPVALKAFNKNLVVWRTIQQPNKVLCVEDRCPHRGAQLSKGLLTAEGTLVCSYHGWEFANSGRCVRIPQIAKHQTIPLACHLKTMMPTLELNQVLYATFPEAECLTECPVPNAMNGLHYEGVTDPDEAFITDYLLEAEYDFWIQIENLLDPAHIHFVHHGFQGDMSKAKSIRIVSQRVDEKAMEIEMTFTHDDPLIPDIRILYRAPGTVDVSIMNGDGECVRRNIIYTTPIAPGKCRVLFRDVAYKAYLVPDGWSFPQILLGTEVIETSYQRVNHRVVESIMAQDIHILESQQMNVGVGLEAYLATRQILLTESDAMIRAFRLLCKKNIGWFHANGYA